MFGRVDSGSVILPNCDSVGLGPSTWDVFVLDISWIVWNIDIIENEFTYTGGVVVDNIVDMVVRVTVAPGRCAFPHYFVFDKLLDQKSRQEPL